VVKQLIEALRGIRHTGVTILLADQSVRFCRSVADRAYVVEKGVVVAEGSMEAICQDQGLVARYLAV
jgi:branched-chain amino acid transport system ATP-binding protein